MTTPEPPAVANLAAQATACDAMGSPFTAALCRTLPDVLDRTTAFGRRMLDWPDTADGDAVALRACGGLHALARSGREPALTAVYPGHSPSTSGRADPTLLAGPVRDAVLRHDAWLTAFLDSPPQTNESARSAVLLGALLRATTDDPRPVELVELGASAGLNLLLDRYRYDLGGGRTWGPPDSPVHVRSQWRGQPPSTARGLVVVARSGCDISPLDPTHPGDIERLLAYVWADQTERRDRLSAALRLAAASDVRVERADVAQWLPGRLAAPQADGVARVVFHTVVRQYLPPATREAVDAALDAAGRRATSRRPLVHISYEGVRGRGPGGEVAVTRWPEGRTEVIAHADMHARWVEWH